MRITKVLRYIELFMLIGIIFTPVVFYSTPLSIFARPPQVDFKEGDIIQLTITEYSFEYSLEAFGDYNVTAGIYLNPIINWDELETGEIITYEDFAPVLSTPILFEGNTTSQIQFNFQIDSVSKNNLGANVTFLNTTQKFHLGSMYRSRPTPFFEPTLAMGLTFSKDDGNTTLSYVHWKTHYLFSTKRAREALNWYSRNTAHFLFDFARYDRNTFYEVDQDLEYLSRISYILQEGSNRLQRVDASFEGREVVQIASQVYFTSNITAGFGLPYESYWSYNLKYQLRYFRGGKEI